MPTDRDTDEDDLLDEEPPLDTGCPEHDPRCTDTMYGYHEDCRPMPDPC